MHHSWLCATVIVLCASAAPRACADGCFFPERAYRKPPTIPVQRALVVYRDGRQRLVVESALDGEGEAFGWVIPLPAAPTEFGVASPGLLRTLAHVTQPHLVHDLRQKLKLVLPLLLACAILVAIDFMPPTERKKTLLVAPIIVIVVAGQLLLPHLGTRGSTVRTRMPGVTVRQTVRVGNYDLAVLDADNATALSGWLEANGYASVPPHGSAIVDDYVKKKWTFVAARLRREGSGLSMPHPLSMTFPVERPVYPMRLTALSGGSVALELYVLSERQARIRGLEFDYCNVFRGPVPSAGPSSRRPGRAKGLLGFTGRRYSALVGHPDLVELFWHKCVLTRLSAALSPDDMHEDLTVSFTKAAPYHRRLYSARGAWATGLLYVLPCASLAFVILKIAARKRIRAEGGGFTLKRIALPLAALSLLAVAGVYLALPKVPVTTSRRPSSVMWAKFLSDLRDHQYRLDESSAENVEEIGRRIADDLRRAKHRNCFTGEPIRTGDSPGNFMVTKDEGRLIVRAFDRHGFSVEVAPDS